MRLCALPLPARAGLRDQHLVLRIQHCAHGDVDGLASPHSNHHFRINPTGAILEKKDLEAIAKVVIDHDLYVLSDEIYAELTYQQDHVTIAFPYRNHKIPEISAPDILQSPF